MIENLTLRGCIEFAVATEELGAKVYEKLAQQFSHTKDISEIFSQLAADELVHKDQFSNLLKQSFEEKNIGETTENQEYLRAMSLSGFFSRNQSPFQKIEQVQDRDDALKLALDFEKATLGFYKAVEDVLGKHEVLSQVIETERSHVIVLMKALLVEGSKFRSLQDRWP